MPDPLHDEFNENWPSGRTNHYWFDLNRDWLVTQQPESVGRATDLRRVVPAAAADDPASVIATLVAILAGLSTLSRRKSAHFSAEQLKS